MDVIWACLCLYDLLLYAHTVFLRFLRYLFLTSHISLFFDTWERILCDTDTCICCGLCFLSRSFLFSLLNLLLFCNAVSNHLHYTWRFNSFQPFLFSGLLLARPFYRLLRSFFVPLVKPGVYFEYQNESPNEPTLVGRFVYFLLFRYSKGVMPVSSLNRLVNADWLP